MSPTHKPSSDAPFHVRVHDWMVACFTPEVVGDKVERNHRFLEESLELVQSLGCTRDEAHMLVDYVFGRPVGEPTQETGGVMVTLAALCNANRIPLTTAAEFELARCWTKIEQIRAKQAGKPKHSPLPTATTIANARAATPPEGSLPRVSYSHACALLARYHVALGDRECCGDELQPQYIEALNACLAAMGHGAGVTGEKKAFGIGDKVVLRQPPVGYPGDGWTISGLPRHPGDLLIIKLADHRDLCVFEGDLSRDKCDCPIPGTSSSTVSPFCPIHAVTKSSVRDDVKCECVGNWGPNPDCRMCGGDGCITAETTAPLSLDNDRQVFFYEQDHYYLSNFSAFRLRLLVDDGSGGEIHCTFDTSEAAYHWFKFPQFPELQARIRAAQSAHEAFKLAEQYRHQRRPDWDDVKFHIMLDILRAKAQQHEYVHRKLLATGDRELIENSWRDDYWGWGPSRDGQNMLGKLWMEVRAELRTAGDSDG